MKISKTSQWILTIGILAILLISLGVMYSRQKAEQVRLSTGIAEADQSLIKYTTEYAAQKKDVEKRLNEANSRLADLQSEFRQYTESIEINEALFEAAEDTNVTITRLSSSVPKDEGLSGVTYRVFSLSITAEGEVVALLNFVNKLSGKFSAATIESVKMSVPEAVEEGGGEEKSTIDLRLKIYAYEGE